MDILDVRKAAKNSYHRGYQNGLDDLNDQPLSKMIAKRARWQQLAERNREANQHTVAKEYEGRVAAANECIESHNNI
jgi:hypothetical protein